MRQIVHNAATLSQTLSSGAKVCQIVPNGQKWCHIVNGAGSVGQVRGLLGEGVVKTQVGSQREQLGQTV